MLKTSPTTPRASRLVSSTAKGQVINLDDEKLLLAKTSELANVFERLQFEHISTLTRLEDSFKNLQIAPDTIQSMQLAMVQRFDIFASVTEQMKVVTDGIKLPTLELNAAVDLQQKFSQLLSDAYSPSIVGNLLESVHDMSNSIDGLFQAMPEAWLHLPQFPRLTIVKETFESYPHLLHDESDELVYPNPPQTITVEHFETIQVTMAELKESSGQNHLQVGQRLAALETQNNSILGFLQSLPKGDVTCTACGNLVARVQLFMMIGEWKCPSCKRMRRIPSADVKFVPTITK